MVKVIRVNGVEYDGRYSFGFDGEKKFIDFVVPIEYTEAKEVFCDGAAIEIINKDSQTEALPDFKFVVSYHDSNDGTITIRYREMTALEKMIEVHYGGVNYETGV